MHKRASLIFLSLSMSNLNIDTRSFGHRMPGDCRVFSSSGDRRASPAPADRRSPDECHERQAGTRAQDLCPHQLPEGALRRNRGKQSGWGRERMVGEGKSEG